MNIFNIIDENTVKISDEITSELSFIENTDKDYETYMAVSNESVKLNVYLYENIGVEDLKDTVKQGVKYIWSLLVNAFYNYG